jgi:hypothetical protein
MINWFSSNIYLENSIIKPTRGKLEGIVSAIIECPSSADGETHVCTGLEDSPDPGSAMFIHSLLHQPVRVPPIYVKASSIQHELRPIPLHKTQLFLFMTMTRHQVMM